jgi:2-dehydro-3-deoxyphosphogluconate aldolase / (4S)-4-hydroxy-2-oxoglutarate aldolase
MPPVQVDPNDLFSVILAHSGASYIVLDMTPQHSPGTHQEREAPPLHRINTWALRPGLRPNSNSRSDRDRIHRTRKIFPTEADGGANYLKSISSPIPAARFCPTGAIYTTNAASYLTVPNVGCIGGSWITPSDVPRHTTGHA